ncbi:MAG: 3-deoxy-7-phosphoheptulonate synthase [Candidatus Ornithospirochaeta sp.]|nr:3-deoxy-7-phosphoheptulonate synthase [Candidatus Ornithospirochaeta sp.]
MSNRNSQDVRIERVDSLETPAEIASKYPLSNEGSASIRKFRETVNAIIKGNDSRLLGIIGPCSIHDPDAAIEYAKKLKKLADEVSDVFFIVMRTYFEKPRTTLGWKGLIMDPDMNETYDISKGLMIARKLLLDITQIGLPVGCEVLDPIIPQYTDELMSWSSIGARTTESQTHRSLASGLSVAVGFKNSTSGDLTVAVNAAKSASKPASFIGIERNGQNAIYRSTGNDCCHLILRGGDQGPNYYEDDVEEASRKMEELGMDPRIIIDCSHANSRKDYSKQKRVLRSVIDQVCWGEKAIKGFMLESNLFDGNQKIPADLCCLRYGVSVTDPCIGWDETEKIIHHAADLLRNAKKMGGRLDIL